MNPVPLSQLQAGLRENELLAEYVLDDPQSYVLAVTRSTVKRYVLPAKTVLEAETRQYRSDIAKQKLKPDIGTHSVSAALRSDSGVPR